MHLNGTEKWTSSEDADKILTSHLNTIVPHIAKRVPGLKSLVLVGGYGRGEGGVATDENGDITLLNDLDMYAFTDRDTPDKLLEEVARECASATGMGGREYPSDFDGAFDFRSFFHIDLRGIKVSRLRRLGPLVRYYELRSTGYVLWGRDLRGLIPPYSPGDIPLSEGIRLLMNRMMLLFIHFEPGYMRGDISRSQALEMRYFIAKAYISCAEALLIAAGRYGPTYSKRTEEFRRLYKNSYPDLCGLMPGLADDVTSYTAQKMNLDLNGFAPVKEWLRCRRDIGIVFLHCLKMLMGNNGGNPLTVNYGGPDWIEAAGIIRNRIAFHYLRPYVEARNLPSPLLGLIPLRSRVALGKLYLKLKFVKALAGAAGHRGLGVLRGPEPGLALMAATPLILFSTGEEKETSLLKEAREILYRIAPLPAGGGDSWEDVREFYLKLYSAYYLQRWV